MLTVSGNAILSDRSKQSITVLINSEVISGVYCAAGVGFGRLAAVGNKHEVVAW